jgi:hypothetical protein
MNAMMFAATMLAITITIAALALRAEGQFDAAIPVTCLDEQTREKVRALAFEALDISLRNHIERSFDGWMRDSSQQPERARRGIGQGIRAYAQARAGTQDWFPPTC